MTAQRHYRFAAICLLAISLAACEKVFGTRPGNPHQVTDLSVFDVGSASISVRWTEVENGAKQPADYAIVIAPSADSISWPESFTGARIVGGKKIGDTAVVVFDNLLRGREYFIQVVSLRAVPESLPAISKPSALVSQTTTADAPQPVDDLTATAVSPTSVLLRWTEVDDGRGDPANYVVASGAPTLNWATATKSLAPGTSIGSTRSLSLSGFTAGSTREFQIATIRGTPSDTSTNAIKSNVASVSFPAPVVVVQPFFSDNFDAGPSGGRTNANGFTWTATGSRVLVTDEQKLSGGHALTFRFGPDTLKGDSSAEQRFNMGRNLPELWIEYWLRIPDNYTNRNDLPANNKLISLWAELYSTTGDLQVITEFERVNDTDSRARMLSMSENYPTWTIRRDGYQNQAFMTESLRGQWKRIRIHFKASSASQLTDGIYEGWMDNTLMWRSVNWSFYYPGGRNYLRQGYLMGWANSGYAQLTTFYIDDIKFYDVNPNWTF